MPENSQSSPGADSPGCCAEVHAEPVLILADPPSSTLEHCMEQEVLLFKAVLVQQKKPLNCGVPTAAGFWLAVDHPSQAQLLSCLLVELISAVLTSHIFMSNCTGSACHWTCLEGTMTKLVFYPLQFLFMIRRVLEQPSITHLKKMPHRSQHMFLFLHNHAGRSLWFCFVPSSMTSRFLRSGVNLLTQPGETTSIALHAFHDNAHISLIHSRAQTLQEAESNFTGQKTLTRVL